MYVGVSCRADSTLEFPFWSRAFSPAFARRLRHRRAGRAARGGGRIGRNIMRAALGNKDIDFVAVNDLTNAAPLAHLLKYDSVLGNLKAKVEATGDGISVDGDSFTVLSMRDPAQLPWKDLGVDVVFESTGLFTKRDDAAKHVAAGARRVVITAPASGPDITVV